MSKSEILLNSETSTIQVTTNIFLDDLEEALATQGISGLRLFSDKEDSLANDYISGYLFEKIQFSQSDKAIKFNFIGKEISEDLTSIWCYFESDSLAIQEEITITNNVLFHLFDDQKNIVVLKTDKENKHYILDEDDFEIVKDAGY